MAVLSDDMGGITAYAAAVNRGYTGTKEEFEQLMYSYTEVAERAEAAAGNAHESEENSIEAKDISVSAKNEAVSARDAAVSARDASISAKNNSESARDAAISAKDDTLAAKDAVMGAKGSVDETSANFSEAVTAAISDVNAAGRNQKELAKTHAIDSEAWAVGQREGADVGVSDTTYHNNSKYYAEQSEAAKDDSVSAKIAAESAKADAITAKNEAETARGQAQGIVDGINAKSEQIDQNAEDISDLQTAISTKAEVDGNYENLTAGTAEQLASTVFIEDNSPYHFRTSGGSADIGDREYDQIVGGTINWNQLSDNSRASTTLNGITFTNNGDGSITANGTATETTTFNSIEHNGVTAQLNHVYLITGCPSNSSSGAYVWDPFQAVSTNNSKKGVIYKRTNTSNRLLTQIYVTATNTLENVVFKPQLFDLTQMFGSTIADYIYSLEQAHAGDGVAWFRKYFPKDYYEYNAGELISVSGLSAHKMTGFNQWDEEWEQGVVLTTTGENYPSVTQIRSKNYIPCLPSTTYYFSTQTEASGLYANVCFYDANKNYISYAGVYSPKSTTNPNYANPFNTPANCRYMRFTISASYGAAYKNDICINLRWDGERDGEYEPYEEHSYLLDSNIELRGLFKLDSNNDLYADGDIYDADGTVTRKYGVVDLGTLNWTRNQSSVSGNYYYVGPAISDMKKQGDNYSLWNNMIISCGYSKVASATIALGTASDKTYGGYDLGTIRIKDDSYTDATTFKSAMSGVYLVYELATPTTESAQSFTNPQIVDDFGTEEYVTDSIVPVGHITKYANNLRAKLEMAPNSPDGDGDYIVRQTSGLNEYVSLSSSEVIQNINEAVSDNANDIVQAMSELNVLTSDGVVPSTEQILTDKGVTDSVPYHYRKTGGDGADRLYDQIVGGSLAVNQLALNSGVTTTSNGVTYTNNNDGSWTISGTATGGTAYATLTNHPRLANHVYFLDYGGNISVANQYRIGDFNSGDTINYTKPYAIAKYALNGTITLAVQVYEGKSIDITIAEMIFDLTQMFGTTIADYVYSLETATAGAGVAFFKSLFPNDYYPYNSGELVSVSGLSKHKMVGFNQWDEEWEVGGINTSNGQNNSSIDNIRSKNYIKVLPNTAYYCTYGNADKIYEVFYYDVNKSYLYTEVLSSNGAVNTPASCGFMRFRTRAAYGTTYKHDICINLSDPAKNGTYEPYKAHSYPLDSTLTLRGVPKIVDGKMCFDGDTYDADGTVTRRYGVVDLGTLDWAYSNGYFNADVSINVPTKTQWEYQTGQCSRYKVERMFYVINDENRIDNCIAWYKTAIRVSDSAYTDAATFKTAMSGVMLVYELATPTTEEAEPYQHLQQCDPNGTEEYVSTGIVPIGHNSFYPENLKAKIEGLPWNFASLIAPTESTFVATRNYTTGSLFIVDNVLYKATSNIANGGTITPNTNCTATTLAEIISALA